MTNLSVIILVGKEERHIVRCLEKLAPLEPRQIFIVESQKGDRTHELAVQTARRLNWGICDSSNHSEIQTIKQSNNQTILSLVWHDWPGDQAKQFNWALDALGASERQGEACGEWILRLDADEYLTPELVEEIKSKLPMVSADVDGVILKRRHYFGGGWAKHGTYPVRILRLFRSGRGRYAPNQVMDERIEVLGKVIELGNDFVDHSLIPMDEWREKHRGYARREAQQAIEGLKTGVWTDLRKEKYYRLPPYFRAFAYFIIRYVLKGGFLDGRAGWMWNFWQGLWYRCLVDREIGRSRGGEGVG